MPRLLLRRLPIGLLIAAVLWCLPGRLAAELVWSPSTGWRMEGGVLAGVSTGSEGRNALDLMNKARLAEERGSRLTAIRAYNKVAKKYPNSVYTPEALYRVAKLRLARKQYFDAFEAFQNVIGRYPNTKRFNEIVGEQYRIASLLLDGTRPRIWGVIPGFTAKNRAIEYFEYIVVNAPYGDYAPLALMNVARGHLKQNDTEDAINALDRMINNYPQSLLAPEAYLRLAQANSSLVQGPYYDQASTQEAITYFEDFMILFPNDFKISDAAKGLDAMKKQLAESKMKMADFYFYKRDDYVAARVFYNEAITAYPESDVAKLAKSRLAAVEAKAAGKPVEGETKKKRFWLF
ncbi:MAG TPA: outer membrane protein assembly factor BamD [Opitutaceae bacterium]|nr:outer membrane protein assembly factor BamD [Opitutaceae bacterium]HND62555.1 outer membrane protein assembly factor BamD [Opitutaceae bacterium]